MNNPLLQHSKLTNAVTKPTIVLLLPVPGGPCTKWILSLWRMTRPIEVSCNGLWLRRLVHVVDGREGGLFVVSEMDVSSIWDANIARCRCGFKSGRDLIAEDRGEVHAARGSWEKVSMMSCRVLQRAGWFLLGTHLLIAEQYSMWIRARSWIRIHTFATAVSWNLAEIASPNPWSLSYLRTQQSTV